MRMAMLMRMPMGEKSSKIDIPQPNHESSASKNEKAITAKSPASTVLLLKKEAEKIRAQIPQRSATCALCVEGKQMTSGQFASWMEKSIPEGTLCFIIGSSHGLDPELKKECHVRLSMSQMTFPHRMARLLLEEQIYRGFTILAGKTYHK